MAEKFVKHPLDGDVRMVRFAQISGDGFSLKLKASPTVIARLMAIVCDEEIVVVDDSYTEAKCTESWRKRWAQEIHSNISFTMVTMPGEDIWKRRVNENRNPDTGEVNPPPVPDQPEPPLAIAAPLKQIEDNSEVTNEVEPPAPPKEPGDDMPF